jgi:hypothetical protein
MTIALKKPLKPDTDNKPRLCFVFNLIVLVAFYKKFQRMVFPD